MSQWFVVSTDWAKNTEGRNQTAETDADIPSTSSPFKRTRTLHAYRESTAYAHRELVPLQMCHYTVAPLILKESVTPSIASLLSELCDTGTSRDGIDGQSETGQSVCTKG